MEGREKGCPWKFYSMHIISSFVVRGVACSFILSVLACTGVIIGRVNEAQER